MITLGKILRLVNRHFRKKIIQVAGGPYPGGTDYHSSKEESTDNSSYLWTLRKLEVAQPSRHCSLSASNNVLFLRGVNHPTPPNPSQCSDVRFLWYSFVLEALNCTVYITVICRHHHFYYRHNHFQFVAPSNLYPKFCLRPWPINMHITTCQNYLLLSF